MSSTDAPERASALGVVELEGELRLVVLRAVAEDGRARDELPDVHDAVAVAIERVKQAVQDPQRVRARADGLHVRAIPNHRSGPQRAATHMACQQVLKHRLELAAVEHTAVRVLAAAARAAGLSGTSAHARPGAAPRPAPEDAHELADLRGRQRQHSVALTRACGRRVRACGEAPRRVSVRIELDRAAKPAPAEAAPCRSPPSPASTTRLKVLRCGTHAK